MGSDELKPKHPKEVWIQWYGDGDPDIDGEPVRIDEDMCWCTEQVFDHDLGPYILDKDQQIADLKAELEHCDRSYRAKVRVLDVATNRARALQTENRKFREALDEIWCKSGTAYIMLKRAGNPCAEGFGESAQIAKKALDQKEQP